MGVSPTLWKHMVEWLGIESLVDVGCGRGISTSWFVLHGLKYIVMATRMVSLATLSMNVAFKCSGHILLGLNRLNQTLSAS
ncbi:hypothetical protein ACHAWO_002973 [Cyclotella atomus]|uniref:Uncharacterized protein n=1 Tax=Cyclotella atomus TaxID=382360 RepID=A0ABD3MVM3_9STRA